MRNPTDPSVPIKDTFKRTVKYRFEDRDEESGGSFNTKTDMLDALIEERDVPKQYQAELNEYIVMKNNTKVVDESAQFKKNN